MTSFSKPVHVLHLTRRDLLAGAVAAAALASVPGEAKAMTTEQARALIDDVIAEVNRIINSGRSEAQMLEDFERLFARWADVPTIARSALGPPARTASAAQIEAFTVAFRGYMARKYGRQFRRFIGGRVDVTGARQVQSFYEVISVARLRGEAPFEVRWHVSDRSGRNLFFNMIIEGVNLLTSERVEIGAMLERRGGNVDRLIQDLRGAG